MVYAVIIALVMLLVLVAFRLGVEKTTREAVEKSSSANKVSNKYDSMSFEELKEILDSKTKVKKK